ncbi:hypothetical protein [Flavobacterium sp. FlaQc-48]|uniref:hypothetical protein n=1 Tax=Flavobacterium sp. FlaQc-48 TaxID=3374181 RepID=UPI003757C382
MKKIIIYLKHLWLLTALLGCSYICKAQTGTLDTVLIKKTLNIYFVIKLKNAPDQTSRALILDPNLIANLDMPSKAEFKKRYGQIEADMFMIITAKPGVKFQNLSQIFHLYGVDKQYQNYPVYVDQMETTEPKTLLANVGSIETVKVNKEKKYIDIETIFHNNGVNFRKEAEKSQQELIKKTQEH